jgi:hypothetical protein
VTDCNTSKKRAACKLGEEVGTEEMRIVTVLLLNYRSLYHCPIFWRNIPKFSQQCVEKQIDEDTMNDASATCGG